MGPSRLLGELEALAGRLGIAVRVEPFGAELPDGRGGLCRLRGRPLVVIDARLGTEDRIEVLAGALATFDLEGVFVAPAVRERIQSTRQAP